MNTMKSRASWFGADFWRAVIMGITDCPLAFPSEPQRENQESTAVSILRFDGGLHEVDVDTPSREEAEESTAVV